MRVLRVQGRRDCDFSTNPGPNSCLTGGCNGGLLCDNKTGTVSSISVISLARDILFRKGVPPVTVAEWTLQGDGNLDFYDGTRLYR